MSLRFMLKSKKLRGIPCFRPILKDPTISDGAFRTLLLLKSKVQNGQVTTGQDTLAKERHISRCTINRHMQELEAKRLIRIVHNSSRGLQDISTYLIEDEFYAKHLAKKKPAARCSKNATGVPYGTIDTPRVCEEPPNIIPYPKPQRKRKTSA